jgi:hypothetical protein
MGCPPPDTEAAEPSISPASYKQTGPTEYQFTLTWPNQTSVPLATKQFAWTNRTQVTLWQEVNGVWTPSTPATVQVTNPPPGPNDITYETVTAIAPPPSGERIKLTLRTWDHHGVWDRDTSVQGADLIRP